MDIWKDVEYQKEQAMKSNKEYKVFLEETLDKPMKGYFQESWDNKIPLEYHTEAVGKPVYHPLTISRVLIYFNPDRLRDRTLKEESLEWFGMTLGSLKEYVENGWIIVQLNTADTYNKKSQQEIENFFNGLDTKPIYVNIVDDLLPSYLGYDNKMIKDVLSEKEKEYRIKELYKNWCNIIKKPIEIHGVKISADKVKENYLKLEILRDAFNSKRDKEAADNINVELKYLEKIKNPEELAQRTYTSFLIYGTPILYCDGSGFVSVGSEPYWHILQESTKSLFGKVRQKIKSIRKYTLKSEEILYFENIKSPHNIVREHRMWVVKKDEERARELEKKIIDMVYVVYSRANEKRSYIEAFKSFKNEAVGATLNKITIPLTLATAVGGYMLGGVIGSLMGMSPLALEVEPIKTIALKCVAKNRIFGVKIEENEIPDMKIKSPRAYKNFRFRVFKIPVEEKDHASEKVTYAELP